jgi:2-phospho-L-lactate/phosphoenolpyruvate guanylyltransferase
MTAALVPAKALDQAKSRLAELLNEDERRRLALAMLDDVLRALRGVPEIDSVYVVSPDAEVLEAARRVGAVALEEPASVRGINQALAHAASSVPSADALLVVLADVPAVTPADLNSVIEQAPQNGVVICPSRAKGTSALFLRPPKIIPFRFGELSFQAHKRQAAALHIETRVLHIESLEHDIDEPDDLRWLMARSDETAAQRLLAEIMPAERSA